MTGLRTTHRSSPQSAGGRAPHPAAWWIAGVALAVLVIATAALMLVRDADRRAERQHAEERAAIASLDGVVGDVLGRESVLAELLRRRAIGERWDDLAAVIFSQPVANTVAFVEPVSETSRAAFERRLGHPLVEAVRPGVVRPAGARDRHLVLTHIRRRDSTGPPVGLDLAADALRRGLMARAEGTSGPVVSPPVDFLSSGARGVVAFRAVRRPSGALRGWIATNYEADRLAALAAAGREDLRLSIVDAGDTLVSEGSSVDGTVQTIPVAGREWTVRARLPRAPGSPVPWLVLGIGLVVAGAIASLLRQGATREAYALRLVAERDTERDTAEAQLRTSEQRLAEAQAIAGLGSWDYHLAEDAVGTWSRELWAIFGLEPQPAAPPLKQFLAAIHDADRDRVVARIAAAAAEAREPLTTEFRIRRADGELRHVAMHAAFLRDGDGKPTEARGTMQDVTERAHRDAEQAALRHVSELVAGGAAPTAVFAAVAEGAGELFDVAAAAVFRFDAAKARCVVVGGWTPGGTDMAGDTYPLDADTAASEVFRTSLPARVDTPPSVLAGKPDLERLRISGSIAAPVMVGKTLWGAVAAGFANQPVPVGAEQRLAAFARMVAMAIANAEAWETLEREAATDGLTGLANSRTFHQRLASEIERARRYGRDLSLALLDLDHFKRVNDLHGHQAGDRVLADFARRLAGSARDGELVARLGGEEFAWLMPETDEQGAHAAADRMRRLVADATFAGVGTVTASVGVCSLRPGHDADELVRCADRALYRAKDEGRNTTRVHAPEPASALGALR